MSTNRYFSFSRLGLVMKRDLMENWKKNLNLFLAMSLAFLAVYLFQMNDFDISWMNDSIEAKTYINGHTQGFATIFYLTLFYQAAEIMSNMRKKESRLSYLVLPATMLEKFVARALAFTAGIVVMLLASSLLAEVVRWAFLSFFPSLADRFKIFVWAGAWGNILDSFIGEPKLIINSYAFVPQGIMNTLVFFWFHSLFILGGSYFGKHAFFKTCGTIISVVLVFIGLGILLDTVEVWNTIRPLIDLLAKLSESTVFLIIGFTFFCFTCFNWWLSYKLFTRQQVIKPKFRLL